MATGSAEFLDALAEAGVSHLFVNFGSDHTGLIEAIADSRYAGRHTLEVVTCPNEMVALSAAHGFAQVSGRPQAVIVHVDCGTQSLAGAVHNAAKGRVPMLIFAGTSPSTQHGEASGSRNEFIQWIQDVHDQRGLVRGYMKYDNEFRNAGNIREITHRALRIAQSDPKGPVYLIGAREIMEAYSASKVAPTSWQPLAPAGLSPASARQVATDLIRARRPLIVTSYLGRNPAAVGAIVRLCERLGIGVLESVPNCVNFPHDHPLYQGNQWNEPRQNPVLADADVILVIDSDVPWIPLHNGPQDDAVVHHIDVDPLKEQMPLAAIASARAYQADAEIAIHQIEQALDTIAIDATAVSERHSHYAGLHAGMMRDLTARENMPKGVITPEYLTARIRSFVDENTIVLNEGISNYQTISNHLRPNRPGALFTSGGGSLGWNGGAAIGVKLAHPERTVVALTGDGSYLFSQPSSVHWMARRYGTPFVQVIFNNGGWKSPMLSTLALHPEGNSSRAGDVAIPLDPPADYAAIAAAAGGAYARRVRAPEELDEALESAFSAVRKERRASVLDVMLEGL